LFLLSLLAVAAVALSLGAGAAVSDNDGGLPLPVTHEHWNFMDPLLRSNADGAANAGTYRNPSDPVCVTSTSTAANVNTDCEGNAPHNETSIAVNPTNTSNQIGAANDYQLTLSQGGTVYETIFTRAHVTNDGGRTWTTHPIAYSNYTSTGDPAVAYDAVGNAYVATLGFLWSQNRFCCTNPDVLVASSSDGGTSWSKPKRVASGTGSFGSIGTFNDKEYIAAWGNGNAIVTWTQFNDGIGGSYISSPIYASVTHDGGASWTRPALISGSASFCIGAQGGTACDQDQFSVPTVAADGSVYVAFVNYPTSPTGRDQYLVVKVDAATGQRVAGPYQVAGVYDGFTDYPINIDGRQTLHDSEFRTNSSGDITADPSNPLHLAVVWSDMRNSSLPAPADPYAAATNSDVIVSQSFDGGATWGTAVALTAAGDQFQPWGAYDPSGRLRIGYFDRSYDAANHAYGYTLATETSSGSLSFSKTNLTTALSDPTQGTRWFSGRTPNASFPHPTTFLGDYSGIGTWSGGVSALWTDLRGSTCFGGRCGTTQDAEFAHGS